MTRIWRYAKAGIRWYLSPSGLLFGLSIALLGVGLLPFDWSWTFTLAGLLLLAVFVPYRFDRQQSRGDRLVNQVEGRVKSAQQQNDKTRSRLTDISRLAGEGAKRASEAKTSAERAADSARTVRRDLAERLAMSERGLANRMASYRLEAKDQLQSVADDLSALIANTERELAEGYVADHRHLADESKKLSESLDQLADNISAMQTTLREAQGARDELGRAVADERNRRIVGFARRDSNKEIPNRIVLIVAVPRSGSTWSFDMLRTIPSVYVEPSLLIWDSLDLRGRRYPAGLSDSATASVDVEVAPGVGAEIDELVPSGAAERRIAIEKLHPEFFGFSAQTLLQAAERLEAEHPDSSIHFVYQLRSPVEVMWSFARYKQRDESWYRQVPMEGIPGFARRTLETVEQLVALRPGLVVDFRDLYTEEGLADLFEFVVPDLERKATMELVARAQLATSREIRRGQQKKPFLGREVGSSTIDVEGPDGAWREARTEIQVCTEIYERLIAK